MATGRRVARKRRLHGRTWNDALADLQAWLDELTESNDDGIPAGFNSVTPSTVQAGDVASVGLETQGWAAADHEHAVETATAVGLANANAEGTGTSLARADHTHKRDVRIKAGAVDNVRNALRFLSGSGVTVTAADDVGDDETELTVALSSPSSALDAQILAWMGL